MSRADGGFRLKYHAFVPGSAHGRPLELSVFRVDGMTEQQIWEHGRQHALPPKRNFHGRAEVKQGVVDATGQLLVDFDEPPPRHANVVGWPKERRDQQLALAQGLASAARSVPPVPG